MNTRKIFSYGIFAIVITLAFTVLSLTGCQQEPDSDDDPTTITYTVTEQGGTDGTTDSTGIEFTLASPLTT